MEVNRRKWWIISLAGTVGFFFAIAPVLDPYIVIEIASIAEVASICAEIAGTNVVFDLPDKIEKKGFSQSKDCILDNSKLKSLGWNGKYTLKQGLVETIESLREDE